MSTDYSPFSGRINREPPPLELVRTLWTMRDPRGREITAAIYKVLTGLELRISVGGELRESRLWRLGDDPLEQRAGEVGALLEAKGWAMVREGEGH